MMIWFSFNKLTGCSVKSRLGVGGASSISTNTKLEAIALVQVRGEGCLYWSLVSRGRGKWLGL